MGKAWDSFTAAPPARSGYKAHNETTMLANGRGLTVAASAKNREAFVAFLTPVMAQCLRVLKPGGYALVWALPRTSHWTATALEDAGFEIRDVVTHLFGQGFPKGKACLKPAAEHWILCRRPAPRVLPLNIDECRISTVESLNGGAYAQNGAPRDDGWGMQRGGAGEYQQPSGRWPANVTLEHSSECVCRGTKRVRAAYSQPTRGGEEEPIVYGGGDGLPRGQVGRPVGYAGPDGAEEVEDWVCHPECAVRLLDEQAGERTSGGTPSRGHAAKFGGVYGDFGGSEVENGVGGSCGNVSRFFYVSKADRADRGEGNDHPCTKSTELMRWLVRLVCRPGETVLDPFAGSGSTGVAALRCERRFVGIERDAHYHAIALKRLAAVDGPLFAAPAGEAVP